MRAGRAVVGVDHDDGDDDGGDDEDHGEEHVLPDERDGAGGGGDELHDDQQEDGEGQQDGDGQSHLLPWRRRDTRSDHPPGLLPPISNSCHLFFGTIMEEVGLMTWPATRGQSRCFGFTFIYRQNLMMGSSYKQMTGKWPYQSRWAGRRPVR